MIESTCNIIKGCIIKGLFKEKNTKRILVLSQSLCQDLEVSRLYNSMSPLYCPERALAITSHNISTIASPTYVYIPFHYSSYAYVRCTSPTRKPTW